MAATDGTRCLMVFGGMLQSWSPGKSTVLLAIWTSSRDNTTVCCNIWSMECPEAKMVFGIRNSGSLETGWIREPLKTTPAEGLRTARLSPTVFSFFRHASLQRAVHLVQSWRNKYLTNAGLVAPDTATALALTLSLDLLPDAAGGMLRKQSASRLFQIVRLNDFKITTGFVGTAFLARALTETGGVDLAYAMLFQKNCPSYLYPVTMGATTTWERWDSMLPDGTVNPGSMTSFNHHALGSIANWLHADVGGLEAIEPGWKIFRVRPRPNKELTWARTVFESKYGRIELKWTLEGDSFHVDLRVPPNCSAVICMPDEDGEYGSEQKKNKERKVGSGKYVFECRFVQTAWPPKAILPPWGRAEF
jgi:alpha-L-rhamnosidase